MKIGIEFLRVAFPTSDYNNLLNLVLVFRISFVVEFTLILVYLTLLLRCIPCYKETITCQPWCSNIISFQTQIIIRYFFQNFAPKSDQTKKELILGQKSLIYLLISRFWAISFENGPFSNKLFSNGKKGCFPF